MRPIYLVKNFISEKIISHIIKSKIKIQVPAITNRIKFVTDLIFKKHLGLETELIDVAHSQCHIYYQRVVDETQGIWIPQCSDLLFSKGYKAFDVQFAGSGSETILFPSLKNENKKIGFDLFSAVFYLVSRYEEYEGFEKDAHGRFPSTASILHKTKSFEYPLINLWILNLKKQIKVLFPELIISTPPFHFISTIDVDSTFQYKEKGFLWSITGAVKDLIQGNFNLVRDRIRVLAKKNEDAFDVFEALKNFHQNHPTELIFFYLLGDYGQFDKNIPWDNEAQKGKILYLDEHFKVGIHPSYKSNASFEILQQEVQRLQKILNKEINISRQHFLCHSYPKTYQNLIACGISEDYTLGYTNQRGFRAGIASPFLFFDLEKDETTNLTLFPFCSMDITPLHYEQISTEEAIQKNRILLHRVREVNGLFISLWHNESLSGTGRWKKGWSEVYYRLIEDASAK